MTRPDDRGGTGHAIFEMCGPIVPDRLVHKNTTNNLAELVAFTHGLRWARHTHHGSVLMRYDSTFYAANIAAGLWKPKKHQAAAARAIKLWADVRRQRPNLWLKHVKGHSNHRWNNRADRLADAGRAGRHAYDILSSIDRRIGASGTCRLATGESRPPWGPRREPGPRPSLRWGRLAPE
jgi:ribonuclease HI